MSVWIVTEKPDHPVIRETAELIRDLCPTWFIDPSEGPPQVAGEPDVVLLKSYSAAGLALAHQQRDRGAVVINDPDAVEPAVDRVAMARRAVDAGVPYPTTQVTTVRDLRDGHIAVQLPIVVKSRFSRGDDLVTIVDHGRQFDALSDRWLDEPVVVQPRLDSTGLDHKLFVVGRLGDDDASFFHDVRRSPIWTGNRSGEGSDPLDEVLLRSFGRALQLSFDLDIFGFDVIETERGPFVVDINPFPGSRGVPGVAAAITGLVRSRLSAVSVGREFGGRP